MLSRTAKGNSAVESFLRMSMKTGDRGCGDLIERLQAGALAHRRPQKRRGCPDEDRLRLLLPGQVEPEEADKLLTHAAECDWGGRVLRGAAPDRDAGRPGCLAVAGGVLASLFFQMGWLGGVPGAQRLTCRAYAEHRESPMRLMACAAYTPMHTERGTESSRLIRPDLLEAEARVARGAETHPNDPAWLRLQGRADLLGGKKEASIAKLEQARALRPKDPSILSDLGMAYFQKAERTHDPQLHALAFEIGRAHV